MEKLIKKYIKKDNPDILHDLRIFARKRLSLLERENKTDKALKELLKRSSKLRDTDVLLEICKNKKAKKHLKKKHKKLRKEFLKFLKNFSPKIGEISQKSAFDGRCGEILKKSFLDKNEKELHKIRIEIKKCRYTDKRREKYFKPLQDALGKVHDYYNCERLLKKYGLKTDKALRKKTKWIKKAEKRRKRVLRVLGLD